MDLGVLAALERQIAGAGHFNDTVGFNQIEEGLNFIGVTGHLNTCCSTSRCYTPLGEAKDGSEQDG